MDKDVKEFAIRALRRASYKWAPRQNALKMAKISYGMYTCALCKAPTRRRDLQLDHITPVIPVTGFDSFDGMIERLLCRQEGWQVLCSNGPKSCHGMKTNIENEERVVERKIRKRKV